MKFRRSEKRKADTGLDLTPVVDVMFQLVLFFVLSSTFVVQNSISIQLPEATGTTMLEQKDLSVTLARGEGGPDGKGPIYVDQVAVASIAELARVLSAARTERPDIRVLIRADATVQTARFVEVLGVASSVGIERYGIAAQPPHETE